MTEFFFCEDTGFGGISRIRPYAISSTHISVYEQCLAALVPYFKWKSNIFCFFTCNVLVLETFSMSFYPNFTATFTDVPLMHPRSVWWFRRFNRLIFFYWLQIMTCAVPIRCVVTDSACHKVALTAVSAMRATRDSLVWRILTNAVLVPANMALARIL